MPLPYWGSTSPTFSSRHSQKDTPHGNTQSVRNDSEYFEEEIMKKILLQVCKDCGKHRWKDGNSNAAVPTGWRSDEDEYAAIVTSHDKVIINRNKRCSDCKK